MNDLTTPERRRDSDRRRQPTRFWDIFRLRGRRGNVRRAPERQQPRLVERFSTASFCLIMALIACTIVDGVITLQLLDGNCVEANPVMAFLLHRGYGAFFLGKYVLTVAGLPVLLVFKNYSLFGTRFRVGFLIPIFLGLYVLLLVYQLSLLQSVFSA
jgi:hypothetical protein